MKYRSETLFGEEYRDAAPVMAHETFELGNTDICRTLRDTILKGSEIANDLETLEEYLNNGGSDEENAKAIEAMFDEEALQVEFFQKVLDEIEKRTGKKINYCLWLADDPKDLQGYCIGEQELYDEDIDCYEETDIVLSDIGSDGKLYGYEEYPKKICTLPEKEDYYENTAIKN